MSPVRVFPVRKGRSQFILALLYPLAAQRVLGIHMYSALLSTFQKKGYQTDTTTTPWQNYHLVSGSSLKRDTIYLQKC